MTTQINNISFNLEEYGQEFSFTDSIGGWHSALLQLPTTPDSINQIDGEEWDSEDEDKNAVYTQLRDYFYSQFKSKEHGKASIAAGFEVTHLVELDGYYVALNKDNSTSLAEGGASSYYNVFYFDKAFFQGDEELSELEIAEKAKNKLFSELSEELATRLANYASKCDFNTDAAVEIGQCFDDETHDFMKSEFGDDYRDGEISGEFYEMFACDIRNDAAREAANPGYRIADLTNGPFGEIFETLEAAEKELAECIREGEEIESSLSDDERRDDAIAPKDFFCIVNAKTGKEI